MMLCKRVSVIHWMPSMVHWKVRMALSGLLCWRELPSLVKLVCSVIWIIWMTFPCGISMWIFVESANRNYTIIWMSNSMNLLMRGEWRMRKYVPVWKRCMTVIILRITLKECTTLSVCFWLLSAMSLKVTGLKRGLLPIWWSCWKNIIMICTGWLMKKLTLKC